MWSRVFLGVFFLEFFLGVFLVSRYLIQLVMSLPWRKKIIRLHSFYWLLKRGKKNHWNNKKKCEGGLISSASYKESAALLKWFFFFFSIIPYVLFYMQNWDKTLKFCRRIIKMIHWTLILLLFILLPIPGQVLIYFTLLDFQSPVILPLNLLSSLFFSYFFLWVVPRCFVN